MAGEATNERISRMFPFQISAPFFQQSTDFHQMHQWLLLRIGWWCLIRQIAFDDGSHEMILYRRSIKIPLALQPPALPHILGTDLSLKWQQPPSGLSVNNDSFIASQWTSVLHVMRPSSLWGRHWYSQLGTSDQWGINHSHYDLSVQKWIWKSRVLILFPAQLTWSTLGISTSNLYKILYKNFFWEYQVSSI